ncbi:MAG TPA: low specificity L-threonine aldolase [Solirubrobacteraceae bacterium]|nr:low specificity L-threonine aldolase [Solirubrobacteraceae bacterium]
MKSFASDNYAGVHPEVLAAIAEANDGHAVSYGADPWTERAEAALRAHFGAQSQALLVFNGSGANVLALRCACRPWEAAICAQTAHVNVDEGGAPERIAGVKLIAVPTPDGKLTPADVRAHVTRVGDEHAVQPRLVTITQSTELGTRYTPREIAVLTETAHELGLLVHVDGARLANAAAGLGVGLGAITTDAGVDIVSLGGTKNGLMLGEAVVFLAPALAQGSRYLRKQTLQLASKGRFLAAQFVAMFEGDLWLRNARHANAMATRLAARLKDIGEVTITQAVEANAVFAVIPGPAADAVRSTWPFYTWNEETREARLMCSWDTTAEDVEAFADAIADACSATAYG